MQRLGHCKGLQLHLDEMKCVVHERGIHILAVSETKLDSEITDNLLRLRVTLYIGRTETGVGVELPCMCAIL